MEKEIVRFISEFIRIIFVEIPVFTIRFFLCLLPYGILVVIIHYIWHYIKRFFLSDIAKKRPLTQDEVDLLIKQAKKEESRNN